MIKFGKLMLAGLWLSLSAATFAQEPGTEAPAAPTPAPPPAPVAEVAKVDVAAAYRREYAFLQAQKRELEGRIAALRGSQQAERDALEARVSGVENRVVAATSQGDDLREQVELATERQESNRDNRDTLQATFDQAAATLEGLGETGAQGDEFDALGDVEKVDKVFALAREKAAKLSQVRRENGRFFLADGTEVDGEIIYIGNIAAFGRSARGSGALAPAGSNRLKLWDLGTSDTAEALASNQQPAVLKTFLYENLSTAVTEKKAETLYQHINSGGTIGWIIVALGSLGLLMAALRALFLNGAAASTDKLTTDVSRLVQANKLDDALELCKRSSGSTARVLAATVRNLDRERAHLEDIISEQLLHESSQLNRFGNMILVIAAVAPLLGLLGTVTGMIATFDIITEFGTSDPKLLSGGIAIALVTTELGLIAAIPNLLIGNVLSGWAESIKDRIEKAALTVSNLYLNARAARSA